MFNDNGAQKGAIVVVIMPVLLTALVVKALED